MDNSPDIFINMTKYSISCLQVFFNIMIDQCHIASDVIRLPNLKGKTEIFFWNKNNKINSYVNLIMYLEYKRGNTC